MNTSLKAIGLSALLAIGASAQTVKTLVSNGSTSQLYDMVILAEGYRSSEQTKFNADVQKVITHFRDNAVTFPYNDYFHCYNVHSVFRASAQSGADQPDVTPKIFVNTAYDCTFNVGGTPRCLYVGTTAGGNRAAADAALAPDTDGRVIILVNTPRRGGCASTFAVSWNGSDMQEVNAHEWGHSFGLLADEYDTGKSGTYTGSEPTTPNITKSSTGAKWSHFSGFAGPNSAVGAYKGAGYYKSGLYRPESNCKMRSTNNVKFCTICREQFIKRFHQECTMIKSWSPASSTSAFQNTTRNFLINHRVPTATAGFEWRIDSGTWLPGSRTFSWALGNTSVGLHTVRVRLKDNTPWVRNDPAQDLVHLKTWTVNVLARTASETNFREILPKTTGNMEGNSSSSFPWNRSTDQRVMYAYGRESVSPKTPVRILGIEYRPNGGANSVTGATFQFALDVSTGRRPATNLSRTFDNNHGADKARAFDGALSVPARNLSGSSPAPFTLMVPFKTPFEWDPRCGPLVLDFRHYGISAGSGMSMDGQSDANGDAGRIANTTNANATTATFPSSGTQAFALTVNLLLDCDVAPRQIATTEGNSATSYPWGRSSAMRVQYVYDGPVHQLYGNNRITRLAWRTNGGAGYSGNRVFDMKVTLSTGKAALSTQLSTNFATNHGSDAKVVFDGSVRLGATGTNAAPSPFNQVLELQHPFDYSDNGGSLVVDIQLRSASGAVGPTFDGSFNTGVGVGRVSNTTSATATTGTKQDFGLAMCISAVPQPVMPMSNDGTAGSAASSYPWNSSASQRAMYVYARQQMGRTQPINITHLSWRPNENSGAFGPLVYSATIDLSSGARSPNALSTTFNANHGSDRQRVFSGKISVPYRSSSGSPADWAISVKLDTPFRWTPLDGPLVVDIRKTSGGGGGLTQFMDGSSVSGSSGTGRIVHLTNANAATANFGPQTFTLSLKLGGEGCNATVEPFGSGCPGANGVPIGSSIGLPWTGNDRFSAALYKGVSNGIASLSLGLSTQSLNLALIGAPACDFLTTGDLGSLSTATDANGNATVGLAVPDNASLHGAALNYQWISIDPSAPGGVTLSNGTKIVICH